MKKLLLIFLIIPGIINAQDLEKLASLYFKGQPLKVIETGEAELKKYPENVETNLMVGRAHADLGHYKEAIPYLLKCTSDTIVLKEKPAWASACLGTCYFALGDLKLSEKYYQAALSLNATKNCNRYAGIRFASFPSSKIYENWTNEETEHFRFHFQDKKAVPGAENYTRRREEAFLKINQFFNCDPNRKIDFYVWNNRDEAADALSQPLGFSISELYVVQTANNQTVGHEMTHVICHHAIKPTSISQLINEGIAVYFDQTGWDRLSTAQKALNGRLFSIYDLWNGQPNDALYPVAGAFIEFLMKKGTPEQMKRLLKDQSIENAKNIYPTLDALVGEFESKLTSVETGMTDEDLKKTMVFNKVSEYPVIKLDVNKKFDIKSPNSMEGQEVEIKPTSGVIIDLSEYLKTKQIANRSVMVSIDFMPFFAVIREDNTVVVDRRSLKTMTPTGSHFFGFWGDGNYRLSFSMGNFSGNPAESDIFMIMLKMDISEIKK